MMLYCRIHIAALLLLVLEASQTSAFPVIHHGRATLLLPKPLLRSGRNLRHAVTAANGWNMNDLSNNGEMDSSKRSIAREVASLGLPALGGMLIDPIMSLVDTACVGQVSSLQLAALAPSTSICQFVFCTFFFLSAATTNLVAGNPPDAQGLDKEEITKRVDRNERVVSSACFLAMLLGTLTSVALFKWSDPLLSLAGCKNASMLPIARQYLRIRALGLPPVLVATVLQGASLGRSDAGTPLRIFCAAGLLNLVGDFYLTLHLGWGAMGAAVATVAAQAAAAIYFLIQSARLDPEASATPHRGVALRWKGPPTKDMVKTFAGVAVTLFLRSMGAMILYSLLTRTAAEMGAIALAAHQVTLQLWWLLSWLPEPMVVAAQTLVARDAIDRPWRVPKLVKVLYGMALAMGVAVGLVMAVALTTPAIASAFVADASVQKLLLTTAPWAVLSQYICPLATVSDGVSVGWGDYNHLPITILGGTAAAAMGLRAVCNRGLGLSGIWMCMNLFFVMRILLHLTFSKKLKGFLWKWFMRRPGYWDENATPATVPERQMPISTTQVTARLIGTNS